MNSMRVVRATEPRSKMVRGGQEAAASQDRVILQQPTKKESILTDNQSESQPPSGANLRLLTASRSVAQLDAAKLASASPRIMPLTPTKKETNQNTIAQKNINPISSKRQITLIGQASFEIEALTKKIDSQMDLALLKNSGDIQKVDLAQMNKFVGYHSGKLDVTFEQASGQVRQFSQTRQGKIVFPFQSLKLDRMTGSLRLEPEIFERAIQIERDAIYAVTIPKTHIRDLSKQLAAGEYSQPDGESKSVMVNRFAAAGTQSAVDQTSPTKTGVTSGRRGESSRDKSLGLIEYDIQQVTTVEQIEHWLRTDSSATNLNRPTDFSFPFTVRTETQDWFFFAASREERQIWVHELTNLVSQPDQVGATVRSEDEQVRACIMDRIDPVEAFNAWNLSLVCGPQKSRKANDGPNASEERASEAPGSMKRSPSEKRLLNQTQILSADENFVIFIRDGQKCYISQTLRQEPFIIDGVLVKELGSKLKRALSRIQKRFVVIDFKKQLVRFKSSRSQTEYKDDKQIPFQQILDAKIVSQDDHRLTSEFKYKILLQAMKRQFIFMARSKLERQIWVDGFQQAISQAKLGTNQPSARASTIGPTGTNNAAQLDLNTIKFTSDNLDVSPFSIQGQLMKRIEKQSMWNRKDFHQRFFKLEFGHPFCYFYQQSTDQNWHKSHKQAELISCEILTEEQIQERVEERKREKSKSLLRRMSSSKVTYCKWNFGFTLQFPQKTYELYAPTRKEREKWVEVLSAIAEMNSKSIMLNSMSPFEYLHEKQLAIEKLKQKQQQLAVQEEEEKKEDPVEILPKKKEQLSKEQVYQQVHYWLCDNQEMMARHEPEVEYSSDLMTVTSSQVKGVAYLIQRFGADLATTHELREACTNDSIRLTQVKLTANLPNQLLSMKNTGSKEAQTFTFSQLSDATSTDLELTDSALKQNRVNRAFTFNFKLVVDTRTEFVFACGSYEDKDEWLRILQLILQMLKLDIDMGKVNPYSFELFKKEQLTYQSMNNTQQIISKPQPQLQESQQILLTNRSQVVAFQNFYSWTFSMNSTHFIEGYLLKAIETKRMLQITKQHLRFFRIIFKTGKMNIKEGKEATQMRSFFLKDLLSVTVLADTETLMQAPDELEAPLACPGILPKGTIEKQFPIGKKGNKWPFTFKIEFVDRNFTLSARTKREMNEWLCVLNLIIDMQKAGFDPIDQNPFAYEQKKLMSTNFAITPQQNNSSPAEVAQQQQDEQATENEHPVESQSQQQIQAIEGGITAFSDEEENINFGMGQLFTAEKVRGRELQVEQQSENQQQQIRPEIQIDEEIAAPTPAFNTINAEQEEQTSMKEHTTTGYANVNNPRSRKYIKEENVPSSSGNNNNNKIDSGVSAAPVTVVNQNITVQNITIHNMMNCLLEDQKQAKEDKQTANDNQVNGTLDELQDLAMSDQQKSGGVKTGPKDTGGKFLERQKQVATKKGAQQSKSNNAFAHKQVPASQLELQKSSVDTVTFFSPYEMGDPNNKSGPDIQKKSQQPSRNYGQQHQMRTSATTTQLHNTNTNSNANSNVQSSRPQVIKLLRKSKNQNTHQNYTPQVESNPVMPFQVDKIQNFEEFGDSGKVVLSRSNTTFQPHEVTQIEDFKQDDFPPKKGLGNSYYADAAVASAEHQISSLIQLKQFTQQMQQPIKQNSSEGNAIIQQRQRPATVIDKVPRLVANAEARAPKIGGPRQHLNTSTNTTNTESQALRISLSKVRLHGSTETLNTKKAAKQAITTNSTTTKPRIIRIGGTPATLSTKNISQSNRFRQEDQQKSSFILKPSPLASLRSAKDLHKIVYHHQQQSQHNDISSTDAKNGATTYGLPVQASDVSLGSGGKLMINHVPRVANSTKNLRLPPKQQQNEAQNDQSYSGNLMCDDLVQIEDL